MQHITDKIPINQSNRTITKSAASLTGSSRNHLPEKWVDAVFKKMNAIYLNKWTSQFATERDILLSKSEWAEGLFGLSADEIKRGLKKCRDEFKWPPSIAEFIQAAKGNKNTMEQNGAAYQVFKPLPKPESNPEVKDAALAQMRGIFNKRMATKKPPSRKIHIPTQKECELLQESADIKKPTDRANNQQVSTSSENIRANQ